jgi:hypothetical protein
MTLIRVSEIQDVTLSRSDPLLPEFPPFMLHVLEVVTSPTESPKCVSTRNEQEPKASARKKKNQIVWFGEPDGPVLSILTTVRGTTGTRRGRFSSGQATTGWKIGKNHGNPRG